MSQTNLKRPTIYQFAFGDMVITNILDGYAHRQDMHPFVATNATKAELEALASEYHLPFPQMEHNFVATVIQTPDKLVAIDPGFGAAAPSPTTGWYMRGLEAAGYSADQVDMVLISHCHPDHVGNIATDGVPNFPNAEIVINAAEFNYWKRGEAISDMRQPTLALFRKVLLPLENEMRMIEPGEEITPGLMALDGAGHSAGHLVFRLTSGERDLLIINDATPHYVASFAHPEWHFSMDDNPRIAAATRRRILELAVAEDLPVIGFHLPFPSIGYVDRKQDGFEFRPATYQFNLG